MEVVYTRHARARMRWRGITKKEVEEVLAVPDRRVLLPGMKFHCFKSIGKCYLRVTGALENNKCVIISVVDKSD